MPGTQTPPDQAANSAAGYDTGTDPKRRKEGDHSIYPNITISGATIFAYAEDGVLTVSVDLDDALSGESPVWAAYGPAGRLIPIRITVQGTEVFRATPEPAPQVTAAETALTGPLAALLSGFTARVSEECVKRDLELVHSCGAQICDVQHDDTLEVLARTAADHAASCAA